MTRLYVSVSALITLFSLSLGFFGATAWDSWWVWAVVGAVLLLAFLALGGRLVPPSRAAVAEGDRASANALLQMFGALCALEVLTLGLVLWVWGNRGHSGSTGYQILGLLIFLALVGVGVQGAVITFARFLKERATVHNAERAASVTHAAGPTHTAGSTHAPAPSH